MKNTPLWTFTGLLASSSLAGAALTNYWPLNETTGTTAANSAGGGVAAELFAGAQWVNDPVRGQVLELDGVDAYAAAGTLPGLAVDASFTWAFWAKSAMPANNNIMIGNRYPDDGWVKFTTAAFEYRNLAATFNESMDYADFDQNVWYHHAVVKNGQLFTYYRNGIAQRNTWNNGVMPENRPMYLGGDTTNENWGGRLDEVATWTNALTPTAIAGIHGNKYTPATAPATDVLPSMETQLSDDFSGELFTNWTITDRGLESTASGGYSPPEIVDGAVKLGGTAQSQYWYGSSLESANLFTAKKYSEVSVKRVSLSGTGSARRSSVWIFGDTGHYLHLSQNIGETGWSYNARDDGGQGTFNPTGGGNNLEGMDALDADEGAHDIKLRIMPTGLTGGVNIEMQIDGVAHAVHGFTNFPADYRVILTGQARATTDTVQAVFDDALVRVDNTPNSVPVWDAFASYLLPTATAGTAYSGDVSGFVSDGDGDALTFSKVSGPTWLTVAADGTLSGTPDAGSTTTANLVVRVADPNGGEATQEMLFRVTHPAAPEPPLFGWWPLNDGQGTFGADISGGGNRANITNAATGGLAEDFSVWATDPDFGKVISFNGTDGAGAGWAVVGDPPNSGTLPVMDLQKSFTWSFWAKSVQGNNNDIVLGNRFNASGGEFAPAQFTKFTGLNFEWHVGGVAQHTDYEDLPFDVWAHHVVVKDGPAVFYYRDGVLQKGRTISLAFTQAMPVYFGGGAGGVEAWSGYLHDVRLFNGALSEAQVVAVNAARGEFAAVSPTFTASVNLLPTVPANTPFTRSVATLASDPQNDALVFAKVSGPEWITVSADGVISGTPEVVPTSVSVVVSVSDPSSNTATATFTFRVENTAAGDPVLFGAWPLNDGAGSTAQDTSGSGLNATITNTGTGGLGDNASAWQQDPERGTVLSFEGTDATSARAVVDAGGLPIFDLNNSFTWSFWAKPDQAPNDDIILGNRYNSTGVDFTPAQFVKFTGRQFEWYVAGANQGIDYPDLEQGVWAHHVVVKDGAALFYYRNGILLGQRTISIHPDQSLPVNFGGGPNGIETWRGALSDVRLFNSALTEAEITTLATAGGGTYVPVASVSMAANRAITLTWAAEAGTTYEIKVSKTTGGFVKVGEATSGTFTFGPGNAQFDTATEPRLFFVVGVKEDQ